MDDKEKLLKELESYLAFGIITTEELRKLIEKYEDFPF